MSTRGGAGVFDTGAAGSGRALPGFSVSSLRVLRMDLTRSKRLGVRSRRPGVRAPLRLAVVADLFRVGSSDVEGEAVAPGPFEAVRDRDALAGLMRDMVDLECLSVAPESFPLDSGRGIELPSREMGRLLEASSSTRCLARLAGVEARGALSLVSMAAARDLTEDARAFRSQGERGATSSSRALDGERFIADLFVTDGGSSSRSALDDDRLTPATGVSFALKAEGWFAMESIFSNAASCAALYRPVFPFGWAMTRPPRSTPPCFSRWAASSALILSASPRSSAIISLARELRFGSALGRPTEKVKGVEGTALALVGVCWATPEGSPPSRFATGRMSVKPRRRPSEGGAIVDWALLGCMADMGGLILVVVGVAGSRKGFFGVGSRGVDFLGVGCLGVCCLGVGCFGVGCFGAGDSWAASRGVLLGVSTCSDTESRVGVELW